MAAGDHGDDLLVKNVKIFQLVAVHSGAEPQVESPVGKGVNDLCRLLFTELKLDGPVVLIFVKALIILGIKRLLTVWARAMRILPMLGLSMFFSSWLASSSSAVIRSTWIRNCFPYSVISIFRPP